MSRRYLQGPELLPNLVNRKRDEKGRRTFSREPHKPRRKPGGKEDATNAEGSREPGNKGSGESLPLDEIAREGARRILVTALIAEADEYIERYRVVRDQDEHALVVRSDYSFVFLTDRIGRLA